MSKLPLSKLTLNRLTFDTITVIRAASKEPMHPNAAKKLRRTNEYLATTVTKMEDIEESEFQFLCR